MGAYLDHAATTPLRPEVFGAMLPYLWQNCGNPSAMYSSARAARAALEEARGKVATCIGAAASEICFTSGGTESNNWALQGHGPGSGIVTTKAEHHAVMDVCSHLETQGVPVTYVDVQPDGSPDLGQIEEALRQRPSLLSVIYANNEVGTLSPVAEIAAMADEHGVPLHTDAVAAAGKVPIDVHAQGISLLSASGHKFGGPRGCGFLFVREGLRLPNLLYGGRQERGRRPGTEDVASAVGLAEALMLACREIQQETARLKRLRGVLTERLLALPGVRINGAEGGLPSIVSILLPGIRSESALVFLDARGIECGAGAACSMGASRPSHVLTAMGIAPDDAARALRISMGRETGDREIAELIEALEALIERHRRR
ncbi:MAG: cysteine desulfurase [Clostridia bacterium]|nr:cysteine desulfurase [Clostridia bacterium]